MLLRFAISRRRSTEFLPLCHSFKRAPCLCVFNDEYPYLLCWKSWNNWRQSQEVQPYCFYYCTALIGKGIWKNQGKGNTLSGIKKSLFFWSLRIGSQYKLGEKTGLLLRNETYNSQKVGVFKVAGGIGRSSTIYNHRQPPHAASSDNDIQRRQE